MLIQTDIEHIVAASEAHDSGLRNLTLAAPQVNRHQKSSKDAAEWLPERNRC